MLSYNRLRGVSIIDGVCYGDIDLDNMPRATFDRLRLVERDLLTRIHAAIRVDQRPRILPNEFFEGRIDKVLPGEFERYAQAMRDGICLDRLEGMCLA